ncbi:MAG: hypothetical protein ABJB04_03905 [Betaproteobacteria bacterium]
MNAKSQQNPSVSEVRNPQFRSSKVPRFIAAVAAIAITVVLFDGVALLGNDDSRPNAAGQGPVVAQNASPTVSR